jgi:FAD/FMN-containing dehydrogenase
MTAVDESVEPALGAFGGELLREGEPGYEEARRVHNGLVDKRPKLIARCRGTADIVDAVNYTREQGLELAVRGGGHNVAGSAVTDGGVMIDLSLMRGIHVDPVARTVRAQGGVTWGELNRETQLHGLAVTGGVISTTGIAGLTLGGGIGWLMPKHGLAVDNLLSVEIVTADGRVLRASEDEHPDLFWALRGGGGNFGVVSSFEYRLHPVGPVITGGLVVYPGSDAQAVLRFYRDFSAGTSDDLMLIGALVQAPDGSGTKLAAIGVGHFGSPEQAERDLAPLRAFGSPIDVGLGPLPYSVLNSLLDGAYPKGALNYWKSSFFGELSDGAIDTLVEEFGQTPSPMTGIAIEHFHGAVTRIPVEGTAVPHRSPGHNLVITSVWMDPSTTDANIAWTRDAYSALQPYFAKRRYVNYLGDDEDASEASRAAFGPNYDRLVQVKTAYDPGNLFRLNQNIPPKT